MPKIYDSLIRVSKLGARIVSAESTMTILDQRDANEYAIRQADGIVGKEFQALDQSGYSVTESPQWREALARCEAGKSAGIVVAYGDRLTRNWRKVGAYYDALEAAGAEVIIAGMPGIDYRTAEGRAQTGMMAVMSDMQWNAAAARMRRLADRTVERGVPNRVPYGYRRNGTFIDKVLVEKVDPERDAKALVPDSDRAQWVQLIYALRADEWSWGRIADELARRGVPGPRGGRWTISTLHTLVHNRAYLGVVTLGKREVAAAHEPLVEKLLWEAAQGTPRLPEHRDGSFAGGLAAGLLTCSTCGGRLSIVGAPGRGGVRLSYACPRRWAAGKCGRPVAIKKETVDRWVDNWITLGIEGEQPFVVFVDARDLEAARVDVARAEAERKRIVVTAASWDPEDADAAYKAAKAVEEGARAHYDQLAARVGETAGLPDSADAWHALTLDGQRRVLRLLIDRIEVAPPASRSKFADIAARLTLVEREGGR